MLYFFSCTVCNINEVPKFLPRKTGESNYWKSTGRMVMGMLVGEYQQLIKKMNTGAGGCVLRNSLSNMGLTPSSLRVHIII